MSLQNIRRPGENRMKRMATGLLVWLLVAANAATADPPPIDHPIKKEPAYKTSPAYGLLLLGKECRTRVWIVRDHDTLYVDRNGNGDLTEPDKAIRVAEEGAVGSVTFRVPDVTDPMEGRTYKNLEVRVLLPSKKRMSEEQWTLELDTEEGCRPVGGFNPKEKPQDAPVIHFGGRVQLFGISPSLKLVRGGGPTELYVGISSWSPGFAPAVLMHGKSMPDDVHPVAEIVFPGKTPDAKPVTLKVPL